MHNFKLLTIHNGLTWVFVFAKWIMLVKIFYLSQNVYLVILFKHFLSAVHSTSRQQFTHRHPYPIQSTCITNHWPNGSNCFGTSCKPKTIPVFHHNWITNLTQIPFSLASLVYKNMYYKDSAITISHRTYLVVSRVEDIINNSNMDK